MHILGKGLDGSMVIDKLVCAGMNFLYHTPLCISLGLRNAEKKQKSSPLATEIGCTSSSKASVRLPLLKMNKQGPRVITTRHRVKRVNTRAFIRDDCGTRVLSPLALTTSGENMAALSMINGYPVIASAQSNCF